MTERNTERGGDDAEAGRPASAAVAGRFDNAPGAALNPFVDIAGAPVDPAALGDLMMIYGQARLLWDAFDRLPLKRQAALAKTRLEEAVLWAEKAVTG